MPLHNILGMPILYMQAQVLCIPLQLQLIGRFESGQGSQPGHLCWRQVSTWEHTEMANQLPLLLPLILPLNLLSAPPLA